MKKQRSTITTQSPRLLMRKDTDHSFRFIRTANLLFDGHREMMDQNHTIRAVLPADAAEIAQIYNHYITHTTVSFEEAVVSADVITERIREVRLSPLPWFVAEQDGEIVGYAYATQWKGRSAYRFSKEVTVYVSPAHVGKGIGFGLYGKLLPDLKSRGIHAAIGVIALPNDASVRLHEKMGFLKVAHYKEVGFKFNRWIDVGHWQRIL